MLDHVVHADVGEVERVACEVAVEQLCGAAGEKVGEGRRDVVRVPNRRMEVREFDVLAVARDDAYIGMIIGTVACRVRDGDVPWLAMAFSPGQGDRMSPVAGGAYLGQSPPWPGFPSGMTCPAL